MYKTYHTPRFSAPKLHTSALVAILYTCSWLKPHPSINELSMVTAFDWQSLVQTGKKFHWPKHCRTLCTLWVHPPTSTFLGQCWKWYRKMRASCDLQSFISEKVLTCGHWVSTLAIYCNIDILSQHQCVCVCVCACVLCLWPPDCSLLLLTGEKALPDRWAVRLFVGIIICLCVGVYSN